VKNKILLFFLSVLAIGVISCVISVVHHEIDLEINHCYNIDGDYTNLNSIKGCFPDDVSCISVYKLDGKYRDFDNTIKGLELSCSEKLNLSNESEIEALKKIWENPENYPNEFNLDPYAKSQSVYHVVITSGSRSKQYLKIIIYDDLLAQKYWVNEYGTQHFYPILHVANFIEEQMKNAF
jgi:hypothetical protein